MSEFLAKSDLPFHGVFRQTSSHKKFKEVIDDQGNANAVFEGFESAVPGAMTKAQYDAAVRDLVTFLAYVGEPVKLERQRLGIYVLLFLAVFFVIAYRLKKEYWKDVH